MSKRGTLCLNAVRAFSSAKMPATNFTPKPYTGPASSLYDKLQPEHMPVAVKNAFKKPINLHQGYMQWLYDTEGRRYLDFAAGIVTVSVGHCHPKVTAALKEQADILWHPTNLFRHPRIYEYIEQLASKFPSDLNVVYLVNSGSEANELAILLAKIYTGNLDVISLQSSYHGYSNTLLGLTATQSYRIALPVPPGFYHAVHPDPYRGIWGGCRDSISQVAGACSCPGDCVTADKYVHQLHELIVNSVPAGKVAALFAESIQGVGGAVQFPKGYLKKAAELIRKNGGLYVADEVQTGFGRTGDHYWGFETHGVKPDIVTLAKGIGNGFPLAAVVTTKEIAAAHSKAAYFNTFGGNALSSAVGKAVLDVIEEEGLQKNSKVVGEYAIRQFMELQKEHPVIGDVRGQGLMIGVDLVEPGTKNPLPAAIMNDIHENIKDGGVIVPRGGRGSNVFRIKPPMCITKEDVDFAVSVIDDAIKKVTKK